jgi:beta-galactosidase
VALNKDRRVKPDPQGLALSEHGVVPLWVGAMHYWRHPQSDWGRCLDAMKAMGLRMVDTYVPWGVHETEKAEFDFGQRSSRNDVARFVEMCGERGLWVVLRPGPHINAELTYFGLPERIVWDHECQARTPRGNPVMLPIVPVAFPVPSYASDAFHDETARWYEAVGEQVSKYRYPDGPIVMVQVDNEGALYFRDGPYDQDYHPDAIRLFRAHLRAKYKRVADLRAAWNDEQVQFVNADPPAHFDAKSMDELPRHVDWMEFHESLLAGAFDRMREALERAGLGELPMLHNFPLGEAATPLNPARVSSSIDLVGLDYYHRAADHPVIARRTTELASRCEGTSSVAYAAEMGVGFPPFFAPIDEKDSMYTLLCALAYGLRGFSLYMAVDRDRWVGAPIDVHGSPRPLADRYKMLFQALDRAKFPALRRRAPVRLVVPRALRRLARASHAFGPLTPALFHILGAGWHESAFDDIGEETNPVQSGEEFLRSFETSLRARGVPFSYAGGETLDASTEGAQWVVCATPVALKRDFFASLHKLVGSNVRVTIGPSVGGLPDTSGLEIESLGDRARADALVAKRIDELMLPTYAVDPAGASVTVHEDASGKERVVFVLNPQDEPSSVKVGLPARIEGLTPIFPARGDDEPILRGVGGFEVPLGPREVRVFATLLTGALLLLSLIGCKTEPPPPPAPKPSASVAAPPPPLPIPTPEEMAETPIPEPTGLKIDAGVDKLVCPGGTIQWNHKDIRESGNFCVTKATETDAEPVKQGPSVTFHRNGMRHEQGTYDANKRTGHWIVFSAAGNRESEGDWANGLRDGLYVSFWPNGKRSAEAYYKAGKMNGVAKTWDDRGKLMAINVFDDDKLVSQKEFANY